MQQLIVTKYMQEMQQNEVVGNYISRLDVLNVY